MIQKSENLWSIINGMETILVAPIARAAALPTTCVGSISNWNECHTFALTIISN